MKHKWTQAALLGLIAITVTGPSQASTEPKLVLQITVDALRGDLPTRYNKQMSEGGFNYLLNNGIHYTNAHFQHANTETIVGHTAIATGAPPSVNGMIGNVWYDRKNGRQVYNIEDSNYSLLSNDADVDAEVEVDSTQTVAQGDGRSPSNIMTSTISDEIIKANNGQSKSFAVSFKDRGAVSMAGALGKAFWFSKSSGGFVSSDYYYNTYPNWVETWNNKEFIQRYHNKRWELLYDRETYLFAEAGNTDFKTEIATFKRSFPYPYGPSNFPYFTTMLSLSPAGDEITADFVKHLIKGEKLGQDKHTDYLSVSFSALDYVIHLNGPSSLEAEDAMLRLDLILADMLSFVDKEVGLENTLIVLSADHGAPDTPGYVANFGVQQTELFNVALLEDRGVFAVLQTSHNLGPEVVIAYTEPYLYLDHEMIRKSGEKLSEVQRTVATAMMSIEGVYKAVTSSDVATGSLTDSRVHNLVKNNYNPSRSGDIYLVFEPGVYANEFDGLKVASVHGSPWRYDTYVPVIFAGSLISNAKVSREVTPYDIAPTIANYLGVAPPSGSIGQPLVEVLENAH